MSIKMSETSFSDEINVLFLVSDWKNYLLKISDDKELATEFPKYFPNGKYDLDTINDSKPSFKKYGKYDVIVLGGQAYGTKPPGKAKKLGDVLVRLMEKKNIGIITMLYANEQDLGYGIAGKFRTGNWNPIKTYYGTEGSGRLNSQGFDFVAKEIQERMKFPKMDGHGFLQLRTELNTHRKSRVIANFKKLNHPKLITIGMAELVKHKHIQLNFCCGATGFSGHLVELILKTILYIHTRNRLKFSKQAMIDLEERVSFLFDDSFPLREGDSRISIKLSPNFVIENLFKTFLL